jgi:hypothetical protein
MELEPDFAVYWSGLKNWAAANTFWLVAVAGAFLLGIVL